LSFLLIFSIFLFGSLAINIIAPIWPLYIKSLNASMVELGFVFGTSNGMAAILQLVTGVLSDRYGRRRIHIVGTFLAIFPPLLYALATYWYDLIPGVILLGVATSLYTPVRWSIVSDISTSKNRARAYSRVNVAYYLGFIIGPVLGGLVADIYNMKIPLFLSSLFSAFCFILVLRLRETRGSNTLTYVNEDDAYKVAAFRKVIFWFSFMYLLEGAGLGILSPITPIFLQKRFSVDPTYIGILFTVGYGIAPFLAQIPGGLLSDKFDKRKVIVIAYFIASPFYSLFAMSKNLWEPFIFLSISYGLEAMVWSAHQSLRMNLTPSSRWGFVNALSYTMFWGGMTLGNVLSGILWKTYGMYFPYYVSSIIILASSIAVLFLEKD